MAQAPCFSGRAVHSLDHGTQKAHCGKWPSNRKDTSVRGRACRRGSVRSKAARLVLRAQLQQAEDLQQPSSISLPRRTGPVRDWVSRDGKWRVRPIREGELKEAALVQAEAFFQPKGFAPLDRVLLKAFQGEVWQLMKNKLKVGYADGFCCLVAEAAYHPTGIIGTVEVSLQSEQGELGALRSRGLEETGYAYLTSIAVAPTWRRMGIGSALLAAAERVAGRWWQNWVLLHAYDSDDASVALYLHNGYTKLQTDPAWVAILGGRQRVLMAKSAAMAAPTSGSPLSSLSSISTSLMHLLQREP